MKRKDLARLAALAETVYEAQLAKMRGNRAAVAAVQEQVETVRGARRERAEEKRALEEPDAAQLASADLHWDRWTDERLRRLQSQRARLEVEAAAMRTDAQRAFGRRQALDAVRERLAEEAARKAANRS